MSELSQLKSVKWWLGLFSLPVVLPFALLSIGAQPAPGTFFVVGVVWGIFYSCATRR
jgi:hypothetical protein